jgi:predicted deacetylase
MLAKKQNDVSYLQDLIEEGKEVFLRAYAETKTENSETPQ